MGDVIGAVGLAFAVTSLVLDLYNTCRNSATDLRHVAQDLNAFYQVLSLTEHYLLHLDEIRIACEELAADIQDLISKHTNSRLRHFRRVSDDMQPLRMRLAVLISALNTCASELRVRSFHSGATESTRSGPSINDNISHLHELWTHYYQQAQNQITHEPPNKPLRALLIRNSASSTSTSTSDLYSDPSSSYAESFTSTESFDAANDEIIATVSNLLITISKSPQQLPVHAEQVRTLLSQRASFECTDKEFLRTPLIWAIVAGRKDLVDLFLENNALVDTRDGEWNWTPAMWAVMEDRLEILLVLIEKGADLTLSDGYFNRTALLWAAVTGNCQAAELILGKDGTLLNAMDNEGMTPLGHAYLKNHMETAELLVRNGANTDFTFECGSSLLECAIVGKQEEFACFLVQHGADPHTRDQTGECVLMLAIQSNLPAVVGSLLEKGADVDCTDTNGVPALIGAVKNQQEAILGLLMRHRPDVEAKDGDGYGALLWAVWLHDETLVKMLIKSNASVTAVDSEGGTIQKWAEWTGNETIVRLVS